MSEQSNTVQREAAVLFLLAVGLAVPALLLTLGRVNAVENAAETAPNEPDLLLPARAAAWSLEADPELAGRLIGSFLDELSAILDDREPAATPSHAAAEAPMIVTAYTSAGRSYRASVPAAEPFDAVRSAARRIVRAASGRLAPQELRVRIEVVTAAHLLSLADRRAFAQRSLGSPVGIAVLAEGEVHATPPADVAQAGAQNNADLLVLACQRAGLKPQEWLNPERAMWRFRADGFVNAAPGARTALPSPRGLTPPPRMGAASLLRASRLCGRYLSEGRGRDGWYLTFWNPEANLRGGCDSIVDQAAATAALETLGELRPKERYLQAGHEVTGLLMQYTDLDPHNPEMAFTRRTETCREVYELEATARVMEALCRYRAASGQTEVDPWIRALGNFLVFMQRDDGLFDLKYDPEQKKITTPADARNAVRPQAAAALALVLGHRELGDPGFLLAARQTLDALSAEHSERSDWPAADAQALAEALAEFVRFFPAERYTKLAERIGEARRYVQLGKESAPALDMVGGAGQRIPPPSRATARDLSTFAHLCLMDAPDRELNLAAAERAAAYLLRLQYLPENSYYLGAAESARGGIREEIGLNIVRLDTVDAALRGFLALTKVKLESNE